MKRINLKLVLLLGLSLAMAVGCGIEDDDVSSLPTENVVGVATEDANLKILATYDDTTSFSGKTLRRLKIMTDAEFVSTPGARFLGRAYSKDTPGLNGFGLALNEYYVPFGSPQSSVYGFQYLMGMTCVPGVTCPIDSRVYSSGSTIFLPGPTGYLAPPQANLAEGILPVYQYSTPGGLTSSNSGNVSFTVDEREIYGLQNAGIPVEVRVIGAVYHATKSDCDLNRSVFCGLTY